MPAPGPIPRWWPAVHAKMWENWGYQRLVEYVRHESIDEMKHAVQIIDRILFLEGNPPR
jgi:bacterioferritin